MRLACRIVSGISAILVILLCSSARVLGQQEGAPLQPRATTSQPSSPAAGGAGIAPATAARVDGEHVLGAAVQAMAIDLWGKLATEETNLAYSPASIAVALAMTATGARGATQTELLRFLHVDSADALPQLGPLCAQWQARREKGPEIAIANRIFGARRYQFERPFLELLERSFAAPLEALDFKADAERSRLHINTWVSKQTKERILDLLPPRSIDGDTRIVLVNALHFLGDWHQPFTKESTRDQPFHVPGGSPKSVPMMHATSSLQRAEIDGCEVVQLPYVGRELAMLFVLPPKDAAAGAWLSAKVLGAPGTLPPESVRLWLPRFKIEMAQTLALKRVLQSLGVVQLFDQGRSDLTGIANPADPDERLFVAEVYHKAFVRVDEKGTEAAAATAVVAKRGRAAAPGTPREVRFDRPFWFALRHLPTGAPLFVGKVTDPGAIP